MPGLYFPEPAGREIDGLIPTDLAPGFFDAVANHRSGDTVFVVEITKGKTAFDTGVAMVGFTVFKGCHAHHVIATRLDIESTTHTTISAGRDSAFIGQAQFNDRFFLQCRGRAVIDAGTAGYA